MFRRTLAILIACTGVLTAAVADDGGSDVDVAGLYEELFGEQDRAAGSTREFDDDLALAERLLEACRQLAEPQALREHLCERAFGLAAARHEGLPTAAGAMDLLCEIAPARADQARQRTVDLHVQAYRRARGKQRTDAAEDLIRYCTRFGDHYFTDRRFTEALQFYQRGAAIARSIRSSRRDPLERRSSCAHAVLAAQARVARLAEALDTTTEPGALNSRLARACLTELADFDAAAWYAQSADDRELVRMIALARRRPAQLKPDHLIELGDWLVELADEGCEYAQAALLRRARRIYTAYLQEEKLHEIRRLLGETRRADVKRRLDQLSVPHIQPPK